MSSLSSAKRQAAPAANCSCRCECVGINMLAPAAHIFRAQVDKETFEMLKAINMSGLPGVTQVAVSSCWGVESWLLRLLA